MKSLIMENKKVGIITFHRAINYGAVLQAVALQKKIESMGYEAEIIDYDGTIYDHYKKKSKKKGIHVIEKLIGKAYRKKQKEFRRFLDKYGRLSGRTYQIDSINQIDMSQYSYIITGSDQVWNPDIIMHDGTYFLDFVKDKKRCISYGASIGIDQLVESDRAWIVSQIQGFKNISVRESSARILLEENRISPVSVVCDPTLLLEKEQWTCYEQPVKIPDRYILLYSFGNDSDLWAKAKKDSEARKIPICIINDSFIRSTQAIDMKGIGPSEWLYLIHNAECVYTNSYHGLLFSVIYHRPFWIADPKDGTNTRLVEVLDKIGCGDRIVTYGVNYDTTDEMDYVQIDMRIKTFVKGSINYIEKSLKGIPVTIEDSYIQKSFKNHILALNSCTGCTACTYVCPVNCISMIKDAKGSYYTKIKEDQCISCGQCTKICPNNAVIESNENKQRFYALKNKNSVERMESSSGGAYILLAKAVLEMGGVVYGVKYEGIWPAYGRAVTLEEAKEFCKAKYVETAKDQIFFQVKEDLEHGMTVLFTGTPCTVKGLQAYIGEKQSNNLYVVDIICHGVPVPLIYEGYIEFLQHKYKSLIRSIDFRDKGYNHKKRIHTHIQKIRADFNNGKIYHGYQERDPYYQLFWSNTILRECCYDCKYAKLDRCGDITIGDFWGDKSVAPAFFTENGESSVLVNTKKGEELFNKIRSQADFIEMNAEAIMQRNLKKPTEKSSVYNRFWKDYYTHSFRFILIRYADYLRIYKIIRSLRGAVDKNGKSTG